MLPEEANRSFVLSLYKEKKALLSIKECLLL